MEWIRLCTANFIQCAKKSNCCECKRTGHRMGERKTNIVAWLCDCYSHFLTLSEWLREGEQREGEQIDSDETKDYFSLRKKKKKKTTVYGIVLSERGWCVNHVECAHVPIFLPHLKRVSRSLVLSILLCFIFLLISFPISRFI